MDEREQVEALYSRFGPVVYRRCISLLEDGENARDATAQVFIRLLRTKEQFENLDEALPWIFSVTTDYCTHWKREAKLREAQLALHTDAVPSTNEVLAKTAPLENGGPS